jgi:uncharacterized protein
MSGRMSPVALMSRLAIAVATAVVLLLAGVAATLVARAAPSPQAAANRWVVELEVTGTAGISLRIAEDLASIIDDGATRRLVPVIGKSSLQNITDLKLLRGVDMAILQTDVLDYVKEKQLFPRLESSFSYITRLYNEEFHLLARHDIKTIADLANQKVNVDAQGSGTAITANRLFDLLQLKVQQTNDSQEVALEKLRKGEIAALAFVAGKPAPLFATVTKDDGLHLLPIPANPTLTAAYPPVRLTAADYPVLISPDQPVDTVAVGAVLMAADLRLIPDRYRNVSNFVEAFFTGFSSLLTPGHHRKWQEVNLKTELPGWRRYAPADQWLQRNMPMVAAPTANDLKLMFSRFLDQRREAAGGQPMTQQEKDDLFQQFQRWQSSGQR